MTASPLLPPGVAGGTAETEATDAELSRMTELALSRGARAIAIGRGNSPVATQGGGRLRPPLPGHGRKHRLRRHLA